jgi:hypothetical protein
MPSWPNWGLPVIMTKKDETVLIPGAVPMVWIAARRTLPVVLVAPATPATAA